MKARAKQEKSRAGRDSFAQFVKDDRDIAAAECQVDLGMTGEKDIGSTLQILAGGFQLPVPLQTSFYILRDSRRIFRS